MLLMNNIKMNDKIKLPNTDNLIAILSKNTAVSIYYILLNTEGLEFSFKFYLEFNNKKVNLNGSKFVVNENYKNDISSILDEAVYEDLITSVILAVPYRKEIPPLAKVLYNPIGNFDLLYNYYNK